MGRKISIPEAAKIYNPKDPKTARFNFSIVSEAIRKEMMEALDRKLRRLSQSEKKMIKKG